MAMKKWNHWSPHRGRVAIEMGLEHCDSMLGHARWVSTGKPWRVGASLQKQCEYQDSEIWCGIGLLTLSFHNPIWRQNALLQAFCPYFAFTPGHAICDAARVRECSFYSAARALFGRNCGVLSSFFCVIQPLPFFTLCVHDHPHQSCPAPPT